MKILIFGLGSIGLRHARLLESRSVQLLACRSGKGTSPTPTGIQTVSDWSEIERERPDVAFICNPTALHIQTALQCAKRGMHLLIEKPIGASAEGLAELNEVVRSRRLTAYIAYPLRFHPGVEALRTSIRGEVGKCHARVTASSYMPNWRSNHSPTATYSVSRTLGGGVILDLSHEFDLIQYLLGKISGCQGRSGRVASVTRDAEDYADVTLDAGGNSVQLHLNFFSVHACRTIEIDFPDKYFRLDLLSGTLFIETREGSRENAYQVDRDEIYSRQLDYFFDHLHDPMLMNNLLEATPLFDEILEFKDRSWRA